MQYSWLPQERREIRIREKPPLVISLQRYGRLQAHAKQAAREELLQKRKEQEAYQEQLRLGGEELLRKFEGRKLCRTQQEECNSAQRRQKEEQQLAKQRALEESVEERKEEQTRQRQRIEKAQQLLEQLRPGPRELLCAKLQSEVLRGVNAQRQLQTDMAAAAQQQRTLDSRIYNEQVLQGLEEAQQRQRERGQQLADHKRELLASIEQRQREQNADKAEHMQHAREERQRNQRQQQEQREKERASQAAQLQLRREHALAGLQSMEQRRQRLQLLEQVELAQCEVHNEAKTKLESLKSDQAQQRVQRRRQRNEKLAEQLTPRLHYSAGEDLARQQRQLDEMQRAHSVEQRRRRERLEQTKAERLASQRQEQKQAEEARQQEKTERAESMARRLQNELIHVQFKRQQRQELLERQRKLRAQLDKQEQERLEEQRRPGTNYNRLAQLEELREDVSFLDYAHRLMAEAKSNNCPLKPFIRAVEQYKAENRLGAEVRVPRHLITKLTMGRRTKGDSKADQADVEDRTTEEEEHKKKIAENIKKIEALVLEEAQQAAETKQKKETK